MEPSSASNQTRIEINVHEYCVLATSLVEDLASFGQLYRDRGDAENIFDELKNQWGFIAGADLEERQLRRAWVLPR